MIAPPNAAEVQLWYNFFVGIAQIVTPIVVSAGAAMTFWYGKRQAAKADVLRAAQVATAQSYQTNALVLKSTAATKSHDEKLTELQDTADKTHTLVNGQHGVALATILEQAIRLSTLTKLPADAAAVVTAQDNLDAHNAKLGISANPKGTP